MEQPASQPARVTLIVAHQSDAGLDPDKQINEDACAALDLPIGHLLVVCDGMGGHMGGKEASEAAIRTIVEDVGRATANANPGAVLKATIEHAGHVVFDLGGSPSNLLRPGSTIVALLSHANGTEVAHVGDSRAYLLRANTIHPLTRDHSMVQQMVDAGVLKPEEAIGHPEANKITRALGMSPYVEVELRPTPLAHQLGDIFLLASDGLCDLVNPQELLTLTLKARQTGGLELACQQLVSLANARGGHDNITVLLGEIQQCPTCTEVQHKTVVTEPEEESAPQTLPVAQMQQMRLKSSPMGVHPTMIDEPQEQAVPPTWVGDATRDSEVDMADSIQRRRLTWLVVGVAFVVMGLVLIVVSVWWAMAAFAHIQDSFSTQTRTAVLLTSGSGDEKRFIS